MTKTPNKIDLPPLLTLAMSYSESMITDDKIRAYDRTRDIWPHIELMRKKGHAFRGYITGMPAGGKSTIMCQFVWIFNERILKYKITPDNVDLFIKRDQLEYSRFCQTYTGGEIFIGTDEWNPMSETGEGATTEARRFETTNKLMVQRMEGRIHCILCSPDIVPMDPSATLLFEIVETDKEKFTTTALLRYRFLYGGVYKEQLIGHVTFNVSKVIKEDWYTEYRRRKYEKMMLLNKEGLLDLRGVQEAKIQLEIIEKLESLAKFGYSNEKLVKSYIKAVLRREPMQTSILQRQNLVKEIDGTLSTIDQRMRLRNRLNKIEKMMQIKAREGGDISLEQVQYKELEKAEHTLIEVIMSIKTDLKRIVELGGQDG